MFQVKTAQLPCNPEIDYSNIVVEDRIIPFQYELDLMESVLIPGPGENQRFCYNITGVGQDTNLYVDLSHFVLGICDEITEDQLVEVTVIINGIEQDVIIGENVEIRTPNNPDPSTGCAGLKFNFGLDKVEGEMIVCFELNQTYAIGSVNVCQFGANRITSGLAICGPVCGEPAGNCISTGYQPVSVCVPVTVTPFANTLPATVFCCGDPTIISGEPNGCPGIVNGSCTFTITQELCIAVPIEFGANTYVGDTFVQCGEATDEDVCTGCGENNVDSIEDDCFKIPRNSNRVIYDKYKKK